VDGATDGILSSCIRCEPVLSLTSPVKFSEASLPSPPWSLDGGVSLSSDHQCVSVGDALSGLPLESKALRCGASENTRIPELPIVNPLWPVISASARMKKGLTCLALALPAPARGPPPHDYEDPDHKWDRVS
jgi:hypothetical protein